MTVGAFSVRVAARASDGLERPDAARTAAEAEKASTGGQRPSQRYAARVGARLDPSGSSVKHYDHAPLIYIGHEGAGVWSVSSRECSEKGLFSAVFVSGQGLDIIHYQTLGNGQLRADCT